MQIVSSTVSSSPVAVSNPHDNLLGGVTAVAMNMTGKYQERNQSQGFRMLRNNPSDLHSDRIVVSVSTFIGTIR